MCLVWVDIAYLKATREEELALEHLPGARGNPYLAASSDFIPRNPAPDPLHPVAE